MMIISKSDDLTRDVKEVLKIATEVKISIFAIIDMLRAEGQLSSHPEIKSDVASRIEGWARKNGWDYVADADGSGFITLIRARAVIPSPIKIWVIIEDTLEEIEKLEKIIKKEFPGIKIYSYSPDKV